MNIHLLAIHCLHIVHLMLQKINLKNATKIMNYEKKKEVISLTDEENKSYKKRKVCYIV